MLEKLRNYLAATLPWDVAAAQYLRLFGTIFLLVFLSSALLHLLLQDATGPLQVGLHAASIGVAYAVIVGLACAALFALRNTIRHVRVWHVWAASFVAFVAGFYLLPDHDLTALLPGEATNAHPDDIGFLQLIPIWALVTYFFVQPYLTESLKSELDRLRDVNALLESAGPATSDAAVPIRFQSGKNEFILDASSIRNIAVDDHYSYVHFRSDDGYTKRDLAMPLRDVAKLLPDQFVQVHRSHIVSLGHVRSIKRHKRSIRLVLDGEFEVPVSRHRLDAVLPLLRQSVIG